MTQSDHSDSASALSRYWNQHSRRWREFQYVYPVISRRSHGLSIGINLNPDKVCNWDCVYCQVDRSDRPKSKRVDPARLRDELDSMLGWVTSGEIWKSDEFTGVPAEQRRFNDIAFSGDGEPTMYPHFEDACRMVIDLKNAHELTGVKLIVLTNMTLYHRPNVQRAFEQLDENNGEIWAKLDAGTVTGYQQIDRSAVPFDRVLNNVLEAGKRRPIVIQTMLMNLSGIPMLAEDFDEYLNRICELVSNGCQIKRVQLYTIARQTAELYVGPLDDEQLDRYAQRFRQRLRGVPCEVFYGVA